LRFLKAGDPGDDQRRIALDAATNQCSQFT
jgi:hypothetical protein